MATFDELPLAAATTTTTALESRDAIGHRSTTRSTPAMATPHKKSHHTHTHTHTHTPVSAVDDDRVAGEADSFALSQSAIRRKAGVVPVDQSPAETRLTAPPSAFKVDVLRRRRPDSVNDRNLLNLPI